MQRPAKSTKASLSVKLSLTVVLAIATLLAAALLVMFLFSRNEVKKEAFRKAERTLEETVLHIDNILLSVEQTAGNAYFNVLAHLDKPQQMFRCSEELLESSPYITGCAIALEPDYYKGWGRLFMAYSHYDTEGAGTTATPPIVQSKTFGNVPYTEQVWYTKPIEEGRPCWINPLKNTDTESEPIITFSLPIYSRERRVVGVLAVDIALEMLSDIVLAAKPSENSYTTLLGSDGSYIVHPDSTKLLHQTVYTSLQHKDDTASMKVARAMIAGETGHRLIRRDGIDCYVFYKPFERLSTPGRSMEKMAWSAAIVYPEDDIFAEYYQLERMVLVIAAAGLLLLLVLCFAMIHRQLLPLRLLTKSAQSIADGHYDEAIPESSNGDEVGQLQRNFRQMQTALATQVGKLQQLTADLQNRGKALAEAYEQAKEAERMKTAVLHNMTNQMMTPVEAIGTAAGWLESHYQETRYDEVERQVAVIQQQGNIVTDLLDKLLASPQDDYQDEEETKV